MTDYSKFKVAKAFQHLDPTQWQSNDTQDEPKGALPPLETNRGEVRPTTIPKPGTGVDPDAQATNGSALPVGDAKDFLANVVPWNSSGYVTINWHLPGQNFQGKSCRTVDDAIVAVDKLKATTRHNIYFCISRQKLNNGHRDRENALGFCCIPIDIDVKPNSPKHYGTMAEALVALYEFCIRFGIPRPSLLVRSGGGLHAYWLSDRVLTVAEWQPFADTLKRAAKDFGLKFDSACTGDAARVLRVPGTLNYKYDPPRPVSLLQGPNLSNGERHDFAAVFGKLLDKKAAQGAEFKVAEAFKHLPLTPSDTVYDDTPLPFPPIKAECGWLREAYETGGKDFDNPQWSLTTLIATFLKDGNKLAHEFGNKHPGYTPESTKKKWDEKIHARAEKKNLGWPQCKTIHDNGSTHCKSCPHFDKGKSPLNIGYEAAIAERRARQIAENIKIGDDVSEPLLPQIMTLKEMRERLVFVGSIGVVADLITGRVRKKEHAADEYAASHHTYTVEKASRKKKKGKGPQEEDATGEKETTSEEKSGPALKFWMASKDRKGVEVLAWVPGAGVICQPPEGQGPAFNTWRGLPPMAYPENWQERVKPFLEHVAYLVPIEQERERFLQWLAHIFQMPEVLPHTSYLMITPVTGIGRNLLASILVRALRGFVAAGISLPELLDKGFTGRLSQKLLIIVDEAREGRGERRYERAEQFKRLQTAEHRDINHKYGYQVVEKNCGRWLGFSNHWDAIPIDDTDRRDIFIANPTVRKEDAYYERLYGLLGDKDFIGSVRYFLETKDITAFRPGEHAPMNVAKQQALNEMMSETERAVVEFKEDCKTQLTSRDEIKSHVKNVNNTHLDVNDAHLTHAIRRAGMLNTGQRITGYKKYDNNYIEEKRFTVVIVRGEWSVEVVKKASPAKILEVMGLGDWSTVKP